MPTSLKTQFTTQLFDHRWLAASPRVPVSKQKLMIVLHGRGDSLEAFQTIRGELRIPEMNYLLLNGPRRFADGFTWCALDLRRSSSLVKIRARLFALVEELRVSGWDASQIFWLGHSQGCLVAADVVMHHAHSFGGMVGVSGYVNFAPGWLNRLAKSGARKTPWLVTHGIRDRIIRPEEIREDILELLRSDVQVEYREFHKGHDFDYDDEVPFIRRWLRSQPPRLAIAEQVSNNT